MVSPDFFCPRTRVPGTIPSQRPKRPQSARDREVNPMPRPLRVHLEQAIYLVTLEGPADQTLFKHPSDYQKYLEILGQAKAQYHFRLYGYSLLPSRLLLLIEANRDFSISQIMLKVTPVYTKYFNARYERKGPLFQKRFRSVIAEKETELLPLTRYIHLSPVRLGLAQKVSDYSFTSYGSFAGSPVACSSVDMTEEIREVLSSSSIGIPEVYESYVLSVSEQELAVFEKRLNRGFILGSDLFEGRVKTYLRQQKEGNQKKNPSEETVMDEPVTVATATVRSKNLLALSGALLLSVALSSYSVYLNRVPNPVVTALTPTRTMTSPVSADARVQSVKPLDLNGTMWEVDLMEKAVDGKERLIKDQIKFRDRGFESDYFSKQGFTRSNYTAHINGNGILTWETVQRNDKGEMVTWRGDCEGGKKMEGVLSYQQHEDHPKDFSFFSKASAIQNG